MNGFGSKFVLWVALVLTQLIFTVATGSQSEAADLGRLNELFQQHFWGSFYQEGRCGPNSEQLVRLALSQGVDLKGAAIIHIENKGGDTFGMVAALQAREQGRYIDRGAQRGSPQREAGDTNWYYHAFVVADGYVFDFDYLNNPSVLHIVDYMYAMFIPNAKRTDTQFIQNKFGGYYLSFYGIKPVEPWESYRVPINEILEVPTYNYLLPFLESLQRR